MAEGTGFVGELGGWVFVDEDALVGEVECTWWLVPGWWFVEPGCLVDEWLPAECEVVRCMECILVFM